MTKTNKSIYNFIKKIESKDGVCSIAAYKYNVANNIYLSEWVKEQNVKLLTLDGSYGGSNGTKFDDLSTDLTAQDDWHIGKKYDMQGWFRYPIYITENNKGVVSICDVEPNEEFNAYLVVSKREMRVQSKNLKRAKTEELEILSNKMVEKYIERFNHIANGDVYVFHFMNGEELFETTNIYGNLLNGTYNEVIANEILSNIPFNNTEFDKLLECILCYDTAEV